MKSKKDNFAIKAYLINLPKQKIKLNLIKKQIKNLDIPLEIIKAYDGKKIKDEDMFLFKRDVSYAVTKSEVGCALSHLKAYKKFIESNHKVALVIEDDISIPYNLKNIISEIAKKNDERKSIVTLLSKVNKYINKPIYELSNGQKIFKAIDAAYAHGYLINRSAAKKLLEKLLPVWCVADQWTLLYQIGLVKLLATVPAVINPHPNFRHVTTIVDRELKSTLLCKSKSWIEIKNSISMLYKIKKLLWAIFVKPFCKIVKCPEE